MIDKNSKLYKSVVFNFISDKFRERGIKLVPKSNFINIHADSREELISLFKFYCESGRMKDVNTYYIKGEDFYVLEQELEKYKQSGNKFLRLSQ